MQSSRVRKPPSRAYVISRRGISNAAASSAWHHVKFSQDVVPTDRNVAQKIGLGKGERVLCFAGFVGDWAHSISNDCVVHYSDAGEEIVRHVKKSGKKFARISIADAASSPQRKNVYDWSFSFEPYAVREHGAMFLVGLRSLLNRKGLKIVNGGAEPTRILTAKSNYLRLELLRLARIYDAKFTTQPVEIESMRSNPNQRDYRYKNKFVLMTMLTNDSAREKAFLDLRVLREFDKTGYFLRGQLGEHFLVPEDFVARVIGKLGVSEKEAVDSLRRIRLLGKAFLAGDIHWA